MTTTTTTTTAPRIYVASLSDYNDGILHGVWIECDDPETMGEEVAAMLKSSPFARSSFARKWGMVAEEWAIHDYEGFGPFRLGEWEQFDRVAQLAAVLDLAPSGAVAALIGLTGEDDPERIAEILADGYGEFDSWTSCAEEWADAFGLYRAADEHDYLTVDIGGIIRDVLRGGGEHAEHDGTVYSFPGASR